MITIDNILRDAQGLKIAVVGDLILDRYTKGEVSRVSPEAPVMVLHKAEETTSLGGAGNVWGNLLNLRVDAHLFCDADPELITGVDNVHINQGPMSIKTRMMSGNHHLLRIDEEIPQHEIVWPIFKDVEWHSKFMAMLPTFNAIIISDYGKGAVGKSVAEMVVALANDNKIPVIIDSKREFERFGGADIVKCNHKEWEALKREHRFTDALDALNYFGMDRLVVTCGEKGLDYYSLVGNFYESGHIPGYPVNVSDVCGAGDTVTAVLAICMALKQEKSMYVLANIAGSEACRHPGVYSITSEDLKRRYDELWQ